jgi:hypothetical protein
VPAKDLARDRDEKALRVFNNEVHQEKDRESIKRKNAENAEGAEGERENSGIGPYSPRTLCPPRLKFFDFWENPASILVVVIL